ncbi:MAG: TolC family protein [Oscillospiraceae bacterium]|nr:TolC family protein [Oscillospiraceae bacterium]
MKNRWKVLCLALAVTLIFGSASVLATPEDGDDTSATLVYGSIDSLMRKNYPAILAMDESIAQLEELDYESIKNEAFDGWYTALDMKSQLESLLTNVNYAIDTISNAALDPTGEDPVGAAAAAGTSAILNSYIAANAASTISSLESAYKSCEEIMDSIRDGSMQRSNELIIMQLKSAENQTVVMAETLYISVKSLEVSESALKRSIAALERTITELELRANLGQISALTLAQAKGGLTTAKSGLATLQMNIRTLSMQLEVMVGKNISGDLGTSSLPEVTKEQLDAMNLQSDLTNAKKVSYELASAKDSVDQAKKEYDKIAESNSYSPTNYRVQQASHTYNSAKFTYDGTVKNFELGFNLLYYQVKDKAQALEAAKAALSLAQTKHEANELKYKQGSISKNALLASQDEVSEAKDNVTTAKYDLFSAYHNYNAAVKYGIVN